MFSVMSVCLSVHRGGGGGSQVNKFEQVQEM